MATESEESLRKQAQAIRNKLDRIETEKLRATNGPKVGQCFVYSNSYGDGKRWNLYLIVTKMDKDGNLSGWSFQKTSLGVFTVETETFWHGLTLNGSQPTTVNRFWSEYRKFLRALPKAEGRQK